ncbi:MAG TPA: ATP-binding protein [Dissulfurispiraceae bacterium]
MKINIASKINLLIISAILITGVSFSILFRQGYKEREHKDIESHVRDLSKVRGIHFAQHLAHNDLAEIFEEIRSDTATLKYLENVSIYDKSGHFIMDKGGIRESTSIDPGVRKYLGAKAMVHEWNGSRFLHFEPLFFKDRIIGFSLFEYNTAFFDKELAEMDDRMLLVTVALALLFILVGVIFSEMFTKPLGQLADATKRISEGDLSTEVEVHAKDELGLLAENFNFMVKKLDAEITGRRKTEEFLRSILQNVGEGLVVVDREFRVLIANGAYCDQLGLTAEEIIGGYCHKIAHGMESPCHESGEDCPVMHTFSTGEPRIALHTHWNSAGNLIYAETKSYPIRDAAGEIPLCIVITADVTERRRLEEQLRHAQKMESIGTLAGGIAHDFNNILTAIIGCAKLLERKVDKSGPLPAYVEQILSAAAKASNLTHGLLAFGRKQVMDLKPMPVTDAIRAVEKLLHRIIGEEIEFRVTLADTPLTVMADKGQLEQVLMNLAANARDAMPAGGVLAIRTNKEEVDAESVRARGYGRVGAYAVVSVSDTGAGMDEKTKERIFEPFYTTKETGKGTGLGLSIVYGIVKLHNGYIAVESEPGKGTLFQIYLPLIEDRVLFHS